MNPTDPGPGQPPQLPEPRIRNPLSVMQPGEQIICEVKRHPIGMLGIYFISGLLLVVLAALAFVVAPSIFTDNHSQVVAISSVVFLLIGIILLGFVFIANKVYWGNGWIVTSDSITQITQTSLFSKQSSQLSLGNLEDVTAVQKGVLQQLFKYGTLRAETAGERTSFIFPYCPNPNYYAQKVLAAREAFEQTHGEGKNAGEQRLYRAQGSYQSQSAQPEPPFQPPAPPTPVPQAPVPPAPVPQAPVAQASPETQPPVPPQTY